LIGKFINESSPLGFMLRYRYILSNKYQSYLFYN